MARVRQAARRAGGAAAGGAADGKKGKKKTLTVRAAADAVVRLRPNPRVSWP